MQTSLYNYDACWLYKCGFYKKTKQKKKTKKQNKTKTNILLTLLQIVSNTLIIQFRPLIFYFLQEHSHHWHNHED